MADCSVLQLCSREALELRGLSGELCRVRRQVSRPAQTRCAPVTGARAPGKQMSGARRARQVLGGAGGAFYAWWMFWASEGAKATIEETTAPALGLALSAATWARDGVQALVARVTGAPRMLTQPQPPWPGVPRRAAGRADGWALVQMGGQASAAGRTRRSCQPRRQRHWSKARRLRGTGHKGRPRFRDTRTCAGCPGWHALDAATR